MPLGERTRPLVRARVSGRVDFVVRSDSPVKGGGDAIQVQHYADELARIGFLPEVVPFGPAMRLRDGSIVHVVNVDRPFELLETARMAAGRPLVVTPVHHDPHGVRAMRATERGRGLRSLVDRLLPEVPRELLAAAVRASRSPDRGSPLDLLAFVARSARAAPGVRRRVGRVLDSAAAVALLAEGEGEVLQRSTGWSGSNAVLVPNGAPAPVARPRPWRERSRDLVLVGRVEPRKRQLEVVRRAGERGLDLTVVGELQTPDSAFGRAFLAAVEASPTVHHLGPLGRAATLEVIGDSRVLLNASWVEVQSLVDLDAAALGCHVVATPAGHSAEWLGGSVRTTDDVHDLDALLDLAETTLRSAAAPEGMRYPHTWASSTDRLAEVYRGLESAR